MALTDDQAERARAIGLLYGLADSLAVLATLLLVFDGPLDGVDIDDVMGQLISEAGIARVLIDGVGGVLIDLMNRGC